MTHYMVNRYMHPDDFILLNHEDHADDIENMLLCFGDCAIFWILISNQQMLVISTGERHQVNGNVARFNRGQGIRLDERWKSGLTERDMKYFLRHGAGMNRRLGYVE